MPAAWTPEFVVGAADAERLISTAFPELRPVRAMLLGAGWDNTAFLINDSLVFRFPRRTMAVPLLEAECQVLPQLAPLLPLEIPAPTYFTSADPQRDFPWPVCGLRTFAGPDTGGGSGCLREDRNALAVPLGRFLRTLHSLPMESLPLTGDTLGRLELTRRLPQARERLAKASSLSLITDPAPLKVLIDAAPPDSRREDALVHGDLYATAPSAWTKIKCSPASSTGAMSTGATPPAI